MLPQFRRFVIVNNSGQTLTFDLGGRINLKETAWSRNPQGRIEYTKLADDDLGFVATDTLADAGELIGDIELPGDSYEGSQIQLEITHDAGTLASGDFDIYLSEGNDSGQLQTDADGYAAAVASGLLVIGALTWESNGLDDEVMRSEIFELET